MKLNDLPEDPVNGQMVMSKAHTFELKNGQKLQFASQKTLEAFLKDPKLGLKGVMSLLATSDHHDQQQDSVLCPVCGMESSISSEPHVVMKHGDQAVHTCSITHAREVYTDILSFQSRKEGVPVKKTQGFCSGSGTTMLNGFSVTDNSTPCVMLWFRGWVLDTRVRYIFGGILVALVAIFNEYLLGLRRVLCKESSVMRLLSSNAPRTTENDHLLRPSPQQMPLVDSCGPIWFRKLSHETQHGVHALLHGVTLFVAYMLMLVSMTYDFTLLLWVVGGYVVGHYIFGERREAPLCSGEMESTFP
ncbi:unnamed protein product [Peronospora farinosa]|uniref:Copper transport protein n=1 Tax=Peronospora farinosa TaxID=134698 RepID=A0AAV0TWX6_9STRA|nr:unnamed protein product [Peronospora farinosa]CAI5728103.1 unnamed protein product [Peronospora farinosa]